MCLSASQIVNASQILVKLQIASLQLYYKKDIVEGVFLGKFLKF